MSGPRKQPFLPPVPLPLSPPTPDCNTKKPGCYCMCGSTTRGGPYPHGRVSNAAECTRACKATGYDYGFCK
jgi:hypothetical protein